jgi:hypothetical protein
VPIWVSLLLDKSLFYRPTYRLLADWATHGLDLSLGTVTDGLKHLVPLFEQVYRALVRDSQTQALWHAKVLVFVLAADRSHDVPEEHSGPVEGRGILVVDRSKAYQAIDKVRSGLIVLAFCGAHVRRDFVRFARSWPDQESWASGWVAEIGTLSLELTSQDLDSRPVGCVIDNNSSPDAGGRIFNPDLSSSSRSLTSTLARISTAFHAYVVSFSHNMAFAVLIWVLCCSV